MELKLFEAEYRFMDLIWELEPVNSTKLAKLCEERLGWKKAEKKPVLNEDLWKQLLALTRRHEVVFHKVKGHADNALNNRCDELARGAIDTLRMSGEA